MPDIILSAHGGRWSTQTANLSIPEGSSISYYVADRQILPNQRGYELLAELERGTVNQQEIYVTIDGGGLTYDYSCWNAPEFAAHCGIFEVGTGNKLEDLDHYTEDNPLPLSDIFDRYPDKRVYWLSCRTADDPHWRHLAPPGSFLTSSVDAADDNLLPGAAALGMGFDALDEFSTRSLTQQVLRQSAVGSATYTFQPTGITYRLPDNVSVLTDTQSSGSVQIFQTEQQFQNYFSVKADISGSYGAFSAEFSAAYSQASRSRTDHYYALYEAEYRGWEAQLIDQSVGLLAPGFSSDPDVKNLPDTFTSANQDRFFTVFRKFGTHIVVQTGVGGALNYYLAVDTSFSSSATTIEANVKLEYDALFVSGSAKSSAEWSQLGESWSKSRTSQIAAQGGDASVLNALLPSYGDDFSTTFTAWQQGVMTNPAIIGFKLRPLSIVFSGDQGAAVSQALKMYMNGAIVLTANCDYTPGTGPDGCDFTTSSMVNVAGTLIKPDPPETPPSPKKIGSYIYPVGGFQVAIIDPPTLFPILTNIYYQTIDPDDPYQSASQIYADILEDVSQVQEKGYYLALSGFALDLLTYPTPDFVNWLNSCGAALEGWKKYVGQTGMAGLASYTAIGQQGLSAGTAIESFAAVEDWIGARTGINASSLGLLYGDSPLRFTPETTRGSLYTQASAGPARR